MLMANGWLLDIGCTVVAMSIFVVLLCHELTTVNLGRMFGVRKMDFSPPPHVVA